MTKKYKQIVCLAMAPSVTLAHEGIDSGSVLHNIAHFGESYGLLIAIPVTLAIAVVLKRRRSSVKSAATE